MTPCQELGYKVGDKFTVINPIYNWKKGQVITLYRDDGDDLPLFSGEGCEFHNADGKPGAFIWTDRVELIAQKICRKKCRRHKRSRKFKATK